MSTEELAREPRSSVMLAALLYRSGAVPARHRVLNISRTGLCLVDPGRLAPGMAVVVSVGQVEQVAADLMWVRGGLAGLRFRAPIDLAAARRRRVGAEALPPAAGWLAELADPYERRR